MIMHLSKVHITHVTSGQSQNFSSMTEAIILIQSRLEELGFPAVSIRNAHLG